LESLTHRAFSNGEEIKYNTAMGFLSEDHHVSIFGLSYIDLQQLPKSIGDLTKLRELSLRGNKLKILPETIGEIESLQLFSLFFIIYLA
jgi:Leucine-rich repeat (LRR) protein